MPAMAVTSWTMVLSALTGPLGSTAFPLAAPFEVVRFTGVRSFLLEYSEDASRRSGVACLVRAIVVVNVR